MARSPSHASRLSAVLLGPNSTLQNRWGRCAVSLLTYFLSLLTVLLQRPVAAGIFVWMPLLQTLLDCEASGALGPPASSLSLISLGECPQGTPYGLSLGPLTPDSAGSSSAAQLRLHSAVLFPRIFHLGAPGGSMGSVNCILHPPLTQRGPLWYPCLLHNHTSYGRGPPSLTQGPPCCFTPCA